MRWPRNKEELEDIKSTAFWLGMTIGATVLGVVIVALLVIGG